MLAGPTHLDAVVARLGRVVLADDGAVLLVLALHLDAEGALRTAHPHRQLHTHTHTKKRPIKSNSISWEFEIKRNNNKNLPYLSKNHMSMPPPKKKEINDFM